MKDFDKDSTPPSPETVLLKPGAGAYPIREMVVGFVSHGESEGAYDDESVEKEVLELAQLVQAARLAVENQGGVFNGTEARIVHRSDQDWMGSTVAISVLYVLAYLPTT